MYPNVSISLQPELLHTYAPSKERSFMEIIPTCSRSSRRSLADFLETPLAFAQKIKKASNTTIVN